jgi:hypothetical protein
MCWSCNPICGGCRPPRKRPAKCPDCNTYNIFDIAGNRMAKPQCKKCAADLTQIALPPAMLCAYSNLMCYNPCKKAKSKPDGESHECVLRVTEPIEVDCL